VTLVGRISGKEISARALLDSGAEGIIIDQDFATKNGLTLRTLKNPLPVRNVDGTLNKRGSVMSTTIQRIRIKTQDGHYHEENAELYVTTLGDNDIIFGTDWLHAHNPEVDWSLPQVAFTRCPVTCTLSRKPLVITSKKAQTRITTINAIQPSMEEEDSPDQDYFEEAMERFIYSQSYAKYDDLAIRAKTTTSTAIAAKNAPKPSIEHIPEQFAVMRRYSMKRHRTAYHRISHGTTP
jgi:hypothetical protein